MGEEGGGRGEERWTDPVMECGDAVESKSKRFAVDLGAAALIYTHTTIVI